ncbi:SDR family NAD(P)-dependent oxidoreductase [Mycolicibacterium moriokaense]|uniref:NAD(P)-dependent dehydrogenase (Short-subunit alcohol dehydrogenase family) n=1 Tax=Mycolicibacterium moriokaense TaxID=39691 RepID=A0A318H772_9MYCO|nr:SDR family NAD(P)-dependent oxidoreductase [Mycolicibacterium moriokaense]PXX00372.1 NAD(P)-dependent dehydrogenase (short-subunit alcohol dehydrogenase family) [Mycolicibacterium moriokaense]
MSDRVVVVTGALTGIGRATAEAYADGGDIVVASGRNAEVGEELVAQLLDCGAKAALFVQTDVRYEDQVSDLINTAVERFGRLDVGVNNAGTDGELVELSEITVEQYQQIFDTNVLGTLLTLKHQLRVMKSQRSGVIVNVSSVLGVKGAPVGAAIYSASKHAVVGLTRSAALEAAPYGVRVNAVAPGFIDTAMFQRVAGAQREGYERIVPLERAGAPEEIASAIVSLTASSASYITGSVLAVDGGLTAG